MKAYRVCGLDGCEQEIYNRTRVFCCEEHRVLGQRRRQADPANQITFECGTCGKTVTRNKNYGASVSGKRFCSNQCAQKHTKRVRHYIVQDMDMVLDSGWEMLFAGLCYFVKIPCERFHRVGAVEWRPGQWYAPDFIVGHNIAVEIKGHADADDAQRWEAFGEANPMLTLVVLGREQVDEIRRLDADRIMGYLLDARMTR